MKKYFLIFKNDRIKATAAAEFEEKISGCVCIRCAPILRKWFFHDKNKPKDVRRDVNWNYMKRMDWKWEHAK